jgi:hypothetical protein
MKLYTEEEVIKAARADVWIRSVNDIMSSLTPIELPSDKEIENEVKDYIVKNNKENFINGAKWMKEQILNQNK